MDEREYSFSDDIELARLNLEMQNKFDRTDFNL